MLPDVNVFNGTANVAMQANNAETFLLQKECLFFKQNKKGSTGHNFIKSGWFSGAIFVSKTQPNNQRDAT